uniref:Uncharacterized protein n=1 Tax=Rhizoctonia solani TaxID=456999 RepID=N0A6W9_9AGAM|nr:hypothetical protein RSOL_m00500 [Rhizoctonia solani]AGK45384.1 hypothetical protein RSOL_m00500 [Rhizoctonia solani]
MGHTALAVWSSTNFVSGLELRLFKSRFKKLINLLHKLIWPRLCLFISWKGWILKGSNLSIEWLRDITNFRAESSKARFSNNADNSIRPSLVRG